MTPSHLLLPFLIAFGVTFAVTPLIKRLAPKLGLVDHPNPRRINKVPMPTGGGLAVFAGFALAARYAGVTDVFPTFTAAAVILAVGLVDDRVGLKASWKFLGQLLGVLVYVIWGSRIEFVSNPFGGMFYLSWLAIPVTVFCGFGPH